MTLNDTIAAAARAGVALTLDGDRLRYRALVGALTPDLRAAVTAHKAALIHILSTSAGSSEYGEALVAVMAALGWERVERRPRRCYACRTVNWRERPTDGWVCATCHGDAPPPARTADSLVATPPPARAHEEA